jgi:predicted double-glycine peptidase
MEVREEEIIELIRPYLEEEIEQLKEGKLPEGGVSMLDLKKVSRELGVPTRGYRIPKEKIFPIMNKLRAPLLVHLDEPEDHFVLSFTGRRRKLILADPSWGIRPIAKDEFFTRWDGLVLAFAPDSNYVDRARKVVDEISDRVEQRNLTGSLSRSLAWEY